MVRQGREVNEWVEPCVGVYMWPKDQMTKGAPTYHVSELVHLFQTLLLNERKLAAVFGGFICLLC